MRNRGLWALLAVVAAMLSLACFDRGTEPDDPPATVIVITNTQNQNSQNGAPSPGPSQGPGSGTFELRTGIFGFDSTDPDCSPKPPNSAGYIPVGCTAAFTTTPKVPGTNTDFPGSIPGIPQWTVELGADAVVVSNFGDEPYNKNILCTKRAFPVRVVATLNGVRGAWDGQCGNPAQ